MKKFLTLCLASAMALSLVACGSTATPAPTEVAQSDLAYIQENGKMIVGYTVFEPMNYTDADGNFTGFDTELTTMVCEKLGVEPEFVIINWDTKEVALNAKDIDCIWNGMTLTAERAENMACTMPYGKNAQVVLMKEGSDYTDTSSLIGKVTCAEMGSTGEALIKGSADTEAEPNLAQSEYVGKSFQADCLLEVKAGTADAAVLDMTLAKAMTKEGSAYEDLVIVDELTSDVFAAAFRQGSDARDAVDEILQEMMADGSLQELADKYNLALPE